MHFVKDKDVYKVSGNWDQQESFTVLTWCREVFMWVLASHLRTVQIEYVISRCHSIASSLSMQNDPSVTKESYNTTYRSRVAFRLRTTISHTLNLYDITHDWDKSGHLGHPHLSPRHEK
jgi:hypothetical protein